MLRLQLLNHSFDPRLISTGLIAVCLKILVIIYVIDRVSVYLTLTSSAIIVYGKGG
ncbi:hypothetical protein D3C76_1716570 [compost metagenome]